MSSTPPHLSMLLHGSREPLVPRRALRAGPLSLEFDQGDLRTIRLGEREVVRRIYRAVRCRNWGTVPAVLSNLEVTDGGDSFAIRYDAVHVQDEIDFRWHAEIHGDREGRVTFGMDGAAHSTFLRTRIGFCVLHPPRECAGARCRVEQADGGALDSEFPRFISAANPFTEVVAIAHQVTPTVWASLRFSGDLFETEDQRNWTDASFKTFCTPLRLPFPQRVESGTRVTQSVELSLESDQPLPAAAAEPRGLELELSADALGPLPRIGLQIASHGRPPSAREIERLRALLLSHLRVNLELAAADRDATFRQSAELSAELGVPLEAAVTLSDAAEDELDWLVARCNALRPAVGRWLVFRDTEWSTSARWIELARRRLASYDPAIAIGSGTKANFMELNAGRPPLSLVDAVCYAIHPQEHAFDNASLVETLAMHAATVESARQFSGKAAVAVSPVTLRKRVNPYATAPPADPLPGELPDAVDVRQMSLFGACWTLGSLKYLAEIGADSATYFETTGWRGVMETDEGSPLPDKFPSLAGGVFPLYHVLADVGEFAAGRVHAVESSDPLTVVGMALNQDGRQRLLAANMTDRPQHVTIGPLPPTVRVKRLDQTNVLAAMETPEAFRAEKGEARNVDGGRFALDLAPFAVVRIDSDQESLS